VSQHGQWEAGEYIVYVKIEDKEGKEMAKEEPVTLATYSLAMPTLTQLDRKSFKKTYPNFLEQAFMERARTRRKVLIEHPLLCYSHEFLLDRGDFGYFIAES
jgi:hypothetical protein